jgi:hypothetical protein
MLVLSTERLFPRYFHLLDAEPLLHVFGNAEVMHFGDYERERLEMSSRSLFKVFIECWDQNLCIRTYAE